MNEKHLQAVKDRHAKGRGTWDDREACSRTSPTWRRSSTTCSSSRPATRAAWPPTAAGRGGLLNKVYVEHRGSDEVTLAFTALLGRLAAPLCDPLPCDAARAVALQLDALLATIETMVPRPDETADMYAARVQLVARDRLRWSEGITR